MYLLCVLSFFGRFHLGIINLLLVLLLLFLVFGCNTKWYGMNELSMGSSMNRASLSLSHVISLVLTK